RSAPTVSRAPRACGSAITTPVAPCGAASDEAPRSRAGAHAGDRLARRFPLCTPRSGSVAMLQLLMPIAALLAGGLLTVLLLVLAELRPDAPPQEETSAEQPGKVR